jgi:hypothetical protein
MIPTSFDESNHVLDKPKDMAREQCDALSVFVGQTQDGLPVVISCWKLSRSTRQVASGSGFMGLECRRFRLLLKIRSSRNEQLG